jgi:CubicO group peptidase (beta-lactamase class C family)
VNHGKLEHLVRAYQARHRVPSVNAAVARDGGDPWELAVGIADARSGAPVTPRHRYRVGSITKTFTAAAVIQLVDEGVVGLDDPLSAHLPEHRDAQVSVRRMLAHLSGMQREAPGDAWETLQVPGIEEMLQRLDEAEQVLPAGERWHYSNLAYALLGELAARHRGMPYAEMIGERLLGPARLTETAFAAAEPMARGYFVQPYTDVVVDQPDLALNGFSGAGGLASTAADLCRWGHALAGEGAAIVSPASLDRMHLVHSMVDHERWSTAWGLGLELHRQGDRLLAGHSGGMPGYLSGLLWSRADRIVCCVLTSSGASGDPIDLVMQLIDAELAERPALPREWRPGEPCPSEFETALGMWWTEGMQFVFSWRDGHLEARAPDAPPERPPAVFEVEQGDVLRGVRGREVGEQLVLIRDDAGTVVRMRWAGYPMTREPDPFVPVG